MQEKIIAQIIKAAEELNEEIDNKIPVERGPEAPLFGRQGVLDSMGLVSLLVSVEQSLADELDVSVTLASEAALSQKRSPFRTIGSLADYAEQLIRNGKNDE